jgi:carbon storage regulator
MLVLERKIGQKVVIDNGAIEVKVLRPTGDTIRLGFKAPKHMEINREEVYLRKILQVPEFLKAHHTQSVNKENAVLKQNDLIKTIKGELSAYFKGRAAPFFKRQTSD